LYSIFVQMITPIF